MPWLLTAPWLPDHVLQCHTGPAYSLSPSAPTVPLPYSHWPDFRPSLTPNLWPLAFALPLSEQTTYILFCDCLLFMSNVFIQSQFLRKALDQFWKLLNPLLPSLPALLPYFFFLYPRTLEIILYISLLSHLYSIFLYWTPSFQKAGSSVLSLLYSNTWNSTWPNTCLLTD